MRLLLVNAIDQSPNSDR